MKFFEVAGRSSLDGTAEKVLSALSLLFGKQSKSAEFQSRLVNTYLLKWSRILFYTPTMLCIGNVFKVTKYDPESTASIRGHTWSR
mmetsp:Transcript_12013/g.30306  ORF Transcript_12013/g.30306 Transcript_12013/m.30306 type:complete len:86 (-) Transcript_12013:1086-1343(-)